jgi:hypothetical protein
MIHLFTIIGIELKTKMNHFFFFRCGKKLCSFFICLRDLKYVNILLFILYMNTKPIHILGKSTVTAMEPITPLAMIEVNFYQL